MLIGSLKLTQFLLHEDEEVVLLDEHNVPLTGIFFLTGPSESGKSSLIVDAVSFALYGPRATRVTASDLTQKDLRNNKASDTEETSVEATFVFDDGSIMGVQRTLPAKGSATAHVWEVQNGRDVTVATSVQAADRYICDRLNGLNRQQLPASFVARQEEIDALARLQGAERRRSVHAMLGVSEIEIARKETAQRQRGHELRLRALDERLQGRTLDSERDALTAAETAAQQAADVAQTRAAELDDLRARRESAAATLEPYAQATELRGRVEQGERAIAQIDAHIETLSQQVQTHRAAADHAAREPELRAAAKRAAAALDQVQQAGTRTKDHAAKHTALLTAVDARDRLRASVQPAGDGAVTVATMPTVAELRETLHTLTAERAAVSAERDERAGQLARLRESGACYVCQRGFDSHDDHAAILELVEERVTALDTRLDEISARRAEVEQLLPDAESAERARADAERKLIAADAQVEQLEAQLAEIAAAGPIGDLDDLAADWKRHKKLSDAAAVELAGAVQAAARLNPDAEPKLADAQQRREAFQARMDELAAMLAQLDTPDADGFHRLTAEVAALDRSIAETEGALPLLRAAADEGAAALAARREEFETFEAELVEREQHRAEALKLSRLGDALAAFTESLVAEIRPTLEQLASDMIVKITDGKRTAIRLDEDYNISVQDVDGDWYSASSLSGGARVRAAICLRLALTRLVAQRTGAPVKFLVMDEPLPAQDPENVSLIMDLLDALRGAFDQVFIISHVGDLHNNEHVDYVMQFSQPPGKQRIKLTYA